MDRPRILVIRFSAMGDIVLISPVIRCLSTQLNARVDVLIKEKYSDVLSANPHIHKIWTLRDRIDEVLTSLRSVNYDLVIDLHKSIRSKIIVSRLGRPNVGFNKLTLQKWLFLKLRINLLKSSHIVDRYFERLANYGITNDGNGLDFYIDPVNDISLPEKKAKRVAIVAGGTYVTKRIPERLIFSLLNLPEYDFFLLGGEDVAPAVDFESMAEDRITNFVGKLSLQSSASILAQCDLIVTGDTGLMHIAAALQKPLLVIWGSTSADFGFYPYYGKNYPDRSKFVQIEDLPCRPCSKFGKPKCPKKHMNCLNKIKNADVISKVREMTRE